MEALPPRTEAPRRERLRKEKELLGLYLSEHPMGEVAEQVGGVRDRLQQRPEGRVARRPAGRDRRDRHRLPDGDHEVEVDDGDRDARGPPGHDRGRRLPADVRADGRDLDGGLDPPRRRARSTIAARTCRSSPTSRWTGTTRSRSGPSGSRARSPPATGDGRRDAAARAGTAGATERRGRERQRLGRRPTAGSGRDPGSRARRRDGGAVGREPARRRSDARGRRRCRGRGRGAGRSGGPDEVRAGVPRVSPLGRADRRGPCPGRRLPCPRSPPANRSRPTSSPRACPRRSRPAAPRRTTSRPSRTRPATASLIASEAPTSADREPARPGAPRPLRWGGAGSPDPRDGGDPVPLPRATRWHPGRPPRARAQRRRDAADGALAGRSPTTPISWPRSAAGSATASSICGSPDRFRLRGRPNASDRLAPVSELVGAVLTRPTVDREQGRRDPRRQLGDRRHPACRSRASATATGRSRVDGDDRFVLKVSNATEDPAFLELQHVGDGAARRGRRAVPAPRPDAGRPRRR